MKIAIMQPTYLPWIGYFDLIDQSDTFVFLDSVQFEKQSWQQRNRIKTPQGWQWLTVPVIHKFPQQILDVEIDNRLKWQEKHWKSLVQNYRKAAWWEKNSGFFQDLYQKEWKFLADLNIYIITWICEQMGIDVPFVKTSDLAIAGEKVDRLINICRHLSADSYLSPPGSAAYIEKDNRFGEAGIALEYHNYQHPIYKQLYGEFVSHMSIVDLLFNEGPQSLDIIRKGRGMVLLLSEVFGIRPDVVRKGSR